MYAAEICTDHVSVISQPTHAQHQSKYSCLPHSMLSGGSQKIVLKACGYECFSSEDRFKIYKFSFIPQSYNLWK